MQIAGIQKTTLVDYPGKVAATLFLRGCNFRCGFCHNPELVLPEQFLPLIDQDEIFRFLESRIGKLQGVCVTGGEPLLWAGTKKLISHIKALGYAVKLDTNGSYPERLREIIEDADLDYIAMDIKSPLDKYYAIAKSQVVGKSADTSGKILSEDEMLRANIVESIKLIMSSGLDYEFRTTFVRPLHQIEDGSAIGKMIQGAERYYIQNFVFSKHLMAGNNFSSFSASDIKKIKQEVSPYVKKVEIRSAGL